LRRFGVWPSAFGVVSVFVIRVSAFARRSQGLALLHIEILRHQLSAQSLVVQQRELHPAPLEILLQLAQPLPAQVSARRS
jgi:hypothetical protein